MMFFLCFIYAPVVSNMLTLLDASIDVSNWRDWYVLMIWKEGWFELYICEVNHCIDFALR